MNKKKHAVIVVHGIGDQQPGWTVEEFAKCYSVEHNGQMRPHREVLQLEDQHPDSQNQTRTFPVHVRRADIANTELLFAEVFWADLSRVSQGFLGLFLGLFRVLFGLRHVASHALDPADCKGFVWKLFWFMQSVSSAVAWVLRGPIAALNIALLLLVGAVSAVIVLADVSSETADAAKRINSYAFEVMGILSLVVVIAGLWLRSKAAKNDWSSTTANTLIFIGITLFGLVFLKFYDENFYSFVLLLQTSMILSWLGVAFLVTLLLALCVISFVIERDRRRGIALAFGITTLTIGIWAFALGTLWAIFLQNVDGNLSIFKEDLEVAQREGLRLIGFVWANVAIVILILMLTWGIRSSWFLLESVQRSFTRPRDNPQHSNENIGKLMQRPRIIVANTLLAFLPVSFLVWLILVLPPVFGETSWLDDVLTILQDKAVYFSIPLGAAVMLFSRQIRLGVDILLDIVSYFRPSFIDRSAPNMTTDLDSNRGGTSPVQMIRNRCRPAAERPGATSFRDRMTHRFAAVVRQVNAMGQADKVTVVAHSQGTIIALTALKELDLFGKSEVELITLGTPYRHIFQHYFGHFFHELERTTFREQIGGWTNIYRVDDFVGTRVSTRNNETTYADPEWPLDIAIRPRGHIGYWSDTEVLKQIGAMAPLAPCGCAQNVTVMRLAPPHTIETRLG